SGRTISYIRTHYCRMAKLSGLQIGGSAVGGEHAGKLDATVGALPVLEQRHDRASDRYGGAVERVQRLGCALAAAALARAPHADPEAAGLVVGGVRARRQLAVAA